MTDTTITKLDAARRQLDSAIQDYLAGRDSLTVHTVADAAFQVLFDICAEQHGAKMALNIIIERIGWETFKHVPYFLKHADRRPHEVLDGHSLKSVYLTLQFAILLYRANGGVPTPDMLKFEQTPDPFKDGYMHKAIIEFFRHHRDDPRLWPPSSESPIISEEAAAALRVDVGKVLSRPST